MVRRFSIKGVGESLVGKPADIAKKVYSQTHSQKKLFSTTAIIGGFLVFISSFVFASNSYNNQQISGTTVDDPSKEQIMGSTSDSQSTLEPLGPGQVAEEDAGDGHGSSSKTTVNIQSSTSSDDGVVSQSYVKEINDEKVEETIVSSSDDGDSSIRLRIDADSDSNLRIRERDGSVKIDYDQRSRIRN